MIQDIQHNVPPDPDRALYESVVGDRWPRYEQRFRRFAGGAVISWNWAAFFATLAWLRHRKLFAWSWAYFAVSSPVLLVLGLAGTMSGDLCARAISSSGSFPVKFVFVSLLALSWILPPLIADRLYFNRVRRIVESMKLAAAAGKIPADGGQRRGTRGAFAALAFQALFIIIAVVGLPSYGHYTYRARVTEGILAASAARAAVTDYFNERRQLPKSNEEIGFRFEPTRTVREVSYSDGTIRVTLGTESSLAGHTLRLGARIGDGKLEWTCGSDDLPDVCLPASCRVAR